MEKWKKINKDFLEDRYYVSNDGKIKDIITNKIYPTKGKKGSTLYPIVHLKCKNGSKKQFLIHRLVAEAFIPNPNNYPIINHIDENKRNNKVDNLEWCNQKHNMKCWWENRKRATIK